MARSTSILIAALLAAAPLARAADRLPAGLLWRPPLANPLEPRTSARYLVQDGETAIAVALGGEVGALRWGGAAGEAAWQLDVLAVVHVRFDERRLYRAADFRAGIPLTWARGDWSAKLAYEHTSGHLGDEFQKESGRVPFSYARDEVVMGAARRWRGLRPYAQAGFIFGPNDLVHGGRLRAGAGLEWAGAGERSHPFAAADLEARAERGWDRALTAQAGWAWLPSRPEEPAAAGRAFRVALELRHGPSIHGQFPEEDDDWLAVLGLHLDW